MGKPHSKLWALALFVALQCAVLHSSAFAQRSFPCLENSIGKTLRWNASWQSDRQDDGHHYQISDIQHFEGNSSYSVVLHLVGDARAHKPQRHLAIGTAASAHALCKRMLGEQRKIRKATPTRVKLENEPRRRPQFIRYQRNGWVRADLPRAQQPLTTCEILGREFLCLEEEKNRFSAQLQSTARQIESQPRLRP